MDVINKSNWLNKNITYLKNVMIKEYDLRSGGLSVIKEYQLLDQNTIDKLDSLPKEKKNIAIGKMQITNPKLRDNMVTGFGLARDKFVKDNGIPDQNILSIKKDALFLINCSNINGRLSNNLEFRNKNTYTSYMYISNKEFYLNSLTNELEIKGFSTETNNYQKDYLFKDIKKFLIQSERASKEMLYQNLKQYRSDYLNRRLPIQTYRNVDTDLFTIDSFSIEDLDQTFIDKIDIRYNFINYIRPMIIELLKEN